MDTADTTRTDALPSSSLPAGLAWKWASLNLSPLENGEYLSVSVNYAGKNLTAYADVQWYGSKWQWTWEHSQELDPAISELCAGVLSALTAYVSAKSRQEPDKRSP